MANGICDSSCVGCVYSRRISEFILCCGYLFDTDQRRPCPAGKGCTVRLSRRAGNAQDIEQRRREQMEQMELTRQLRMRWVTCPVCGITFTAKDRRRKFCSRGCANRRLSVGIDSPALAGRVRSCVICGRTFLPMRHNAICCSDDCRDERTRQRNLAWNAIHYQRKRDKANRAQAQEEGGSLGRNEEK